MVLISTQVINEFINVLIKKKNQEVADISRAIQEISNNFIIADVDIKTIELALNHLL